MVVTYPQLNSEERLTADLKQEMGKRVPVRTKAKLRAAASEQMTMLEQSLERVMAYFQDKQVRYAASYFTGRSKKNEPPSLD